MDQSRGASGPDLVGGRRAGVEESPGERALGDRGFLFTRPAKWGLRIVGIELDEY